MKKFDLFQLTILGIGAWCGFQLIMLLMMVIVYVVQIAMDSFGLEYAKQYFVNSAILGVSYYVIAYFALRKTDLVLEFLKPGTSKHISEPAGDIPPVTDTALIATADIMRLILVGGGVILLIPAIPELLQNLYIAFSSKLGPTNYSDASDVLLVSLVRIILPLFIIAFSGKITSWLKF